MRVFEPYCSFSGELEIGDIIEDFDKKHNFPLGRYNSALLLVVAKLGKNVILFHEDGSFEEHDRIWISNWTDYGWMIKR